MTALMAAPLVGCTLFPCEDTGECDVAAIELRMLDRHMAGAVEFTIRRKDLSEQVTCRFQAGPPLGVWNCDPVPFENIGSRVQYGEILVKIMADYEFVLTGPAGTTTAAIVPNTSVPGDACSCFVARFQIPEEAWRQVGAV